MKNIVAFLSAVVMLCGCVATKPPAAKPQKVIGSAFDYGQYPTNYEEIVHSYIKVYFKDPDSVKNLNIHEPKPIIWNDFQGTITYCYFLLFEANAKNAYGGYAGTQATGLYVRNGKFVYIP